MTHEDYLKFCPNFGFKPEFEKFTIQQFIKNADSEEIFNRIVQWPISGGKGFFLFGKPGRGKSHLLKIKANMIYEMKVEDIINRNYRLGYPQWIELSEYVKSVTKNNSFNTEHDDKAERIKESAMNADWLFINDFGATSNTPTVVSIIFDLIDARVSNRKMTFITSNLDSNQILDFYGERIQSRMFELCKFLRLDGEDQRRKL